MWLSIAFATRRTQRKLEESGQIGSTVTPVYTFDGDPTGKVSVEIFPLKELI